VRVILKRDAWLIGHRIRKGKDGAPIELAEYFRKHLPSDAKVLEPGMPIPPPPAPFGIPAAITGEAHDLGRLSAVAEATVLEDAEEQRKANLARFQAALQPAPAKSGKK